MITPEETLLKRTFVQWATYLTDRIFSSSSIFRVVLLPTKYLQVQSTFWVFAQNLVNIVPCAAMFEPTSSLGCSNFLSKHCYSQCITRTINIRGTWKIVVRGSANMIKSIKMGNMEAYGRIKSISLHPKVNIYILWIIAGWNHRYKTKG